MYQNYIGKLAHEYLTSGDVTKGYAVAIIALFLCAVIGYLLGSINFSLVISKSKYKDDIREHGSGNAGATNMLRTHGKGAAAATFLGDGLKAAVSVLIGALTFSILGAYIAGFSCILGHIFPIYYKFKGGKGVVTVAVMIAMTNIKTFALLLIIFLVLVIGTRFVSLGSVIAVLVYPLILSKIVFSDPAPFESFGVIFAFAVAALVTFKHRENLKRIFNHTENKISFSKKEKDGK